MPEWRISAGTLCTTSAPPSVHTTRRGALEALRLGHGPGHGGPAGDPGASAGRLNRAILERGWGRFVTLLESKLAAQGGQLVFGPATDSSQECPQCGHTAATNRPMRDRYCCRACGYEKMADVKAAETIDHRGASTWACPGAGIRHRGAACGGIGRWPPDDAGTAPRLRGIPRPEPWGGCQACVHNFRPHRCLSVGGRSRRFQEGADWSGSPSPSSNSMAMATKGGHRPHPSPPHSALTSLR